MLKKTQKAAQRTLRAIAQKKSQRTTPGDAPEPITAAAETETVNTSIDGKKRTLTLERGMDNGKCFSG